MLYRNSPRPRAAFRLVAALMFAVVVAPLAPARQTTQKLVVPEVERLRAHVTYLASARLEGRRTGTQGAKDAADYVAAQFMMLGLRPGFPGLMNVGGEAHKMERSRSFLQNFPYVVGVELGKGNEMRYRTEAQPLASDAGVSLRVGHDWMPLGFSANASLREVPFYFVGYGITAAEQNHDDYKDLNVAGAVAVALSGTPDGDNPHGRFTRAGEVRFKAAAARAAGARALVLIASEEDFGREPLARLSYENAGGDAGLAVVVVSRRVAAEYLGLNVAEAEKAARTRTQAAADPQAAALRQFRPNGTLDINVEVRRKNAPGINVVGMLEGSDPKLRHEYIVIGAHYDHLGRGGRGSLATREGEIHHGADDNASGTAALLELARLLAADRERLRRGVIFIAFGGEEEGLLGSNYYVNHPAVPLEQTVAMLNLDMVGRLRSGALSVSGIGTAAEWREWVERHNAGWKVELKAGEGKTTGEAAGDGGKGEAAAAPTNAQAAGMQDSTAAKVIVTGADGRTVATAHAAPRFNLRLNEDGFGPSDHASFYAKKVPVLFFFTGSHEDYHRPTDTADRINYEGLASIAAFVRDLVGQVQASDARPTFKLARAAATARSTGFRVYLGTIPSYGDSTDGLKLDGVREGSPAEKAGLRAGDVIVRLAGRDVRNVYDYTQALSQMKADEEYEVEVVRAGRRQSHRITPAARRQ
jgi:Zn-dependent M28 family amino/carboxypeptidase